MSWEDDVSMLSPAQERQYWLDEMKRRLPYGMAVNCRGMPSLDRTPILRKLVEDGLILRVREDRGWGGRSTRSRRTVLRLPVDNNQ